MSKSITKKRLLETFDFTPKARATLRRLKKRYGTKKNAVETALNQLEQSTLWTGIGIARFATTLW